MIRIGTEQRTPVMNVTEVTRVAHAGLAWGLPVGAGQASFSLHFACDCSENGLRKGSLQGRIHAYEPARTNELAKPVVDT